ALRASATILSGVSDAGSPDDSGVRNSWSQSQEWRGSVSAFTGADRGEMQPSSNDKADTSLLSRDLIPAIQSTAEPDRRPVARRSHKSWLTSSAATVPLSWNFLPGSSAQRQATRALLAALTIVAGIRLMLLCWRLQQIRRFKRASVSPGKQLEQLFQKLCAESALNRTVRIKLSASQRSAALLGFFHPMIVLPAESSQIMGDDTENILRHELAHAR